MPCVAVFNQKGGVGKTTTALNLAASIARDSMPPLLVDFDPQAHLTTLSGLGPVDATASLYAFYHDHRPLGDLLVRAPNCLNILPAHLELAKVDTQYGKGPDVLNRFRLALLRERILAPEQSALIDCSPMLGVLSLSAIFAADRVLVPVSADYLAMKGAMQVERALNALGRVLKQRIMRRYVLVRFDGRRRMSWDIDTKMREHFGEEMCATRITENVALAESANVAKDVFAYASNSRGAQDYATLYAELKTVGFLPDTTAQVDGQVHNLIEKIRQRAAMTR